LLFQIEFTGKKNEFEIAENFRDNKKEDVSLKKFAEELVSGTISNLVKIDKIIQESAEHWKVDRMAAVDRNILRFAVYEILYRNDIPPAVTINEALEIAKKYSSSDSVPFINGLLDKIAHDSGKA
jgi:N utilization substance protein B